MDFKKLLPHLIAAGVLLAVAAFFFAPNAFSGKALPQPDNDKARAMQTEIQQYIKKDGIAPLWTNSAFGGMPSYQIYAPIHGNLTIPIFNGLLLFSDISTAIWVQVLLAMLTTYFLLCVMKVDWRVAIFGALAYGITSYNVDILEAGHTTKMIALAFAPGILAGMVLTFNGRLLLGGSLTALFMAMEVYANHVQITYYTMLLCGIYMLAKLIDEIRGKTLTAWIKAVVVLGLAFVLGFGSNLSRLWSTYEYAQETIRGKSELQQKASKGDGLDKDYLFGWSYGWDEISTLIVPHYAGGGGVETYKNTKLYEAVSPQARNQIGGLFYTGNQPFVGTAIYFGAIVCFLFFLGAWLVPGAPKYWLAGGGLFMVSLALGKDFPLNFLLYDVLPMFNKFRAVSMALGVAQLCFALLAALGLQQFMDAGVDTTRKRTALIGAAGLAAGWCLLAWMTGGTSGNHDNVLDQSPELLALLREDRATMLRNDVLRSLFFIAIGAGTLWLYLQGRMKAVVAVPLIAIAALADHWMVATRTLTPDKYESKRTALAPPQEEEFDKQIKQDNDIHYRVLDLARGSITSNAITSYFHKSLSGYHAAKLQRYQEVVDSFLVPGLANSLQIVGMFNGKYIVSQKGEVMRNPEACGHAWFVRHFNVVPNADAELQALRQLHPKDTAVIQEAYAGALKGFNLQPDSTARIDLVHYHPAKMEYEYSAQQEQLAVFPEIYYPPSKGWKCYLNGQPAPDFIKADYLLRAMRLPAGQNMKLEMRFEPKSFSLGEKIAMILSALVLLLFAGALVLWYRSHTLADPNRLVDVARPGKEKPARQAAVREKPGKKKR